MIVTETHGGHWLSTGLEELGGHLPVPSSAHITSSLTGAKESSSLQNKPGV